MAFHGISRVTARLSSGLPTSAVCSVFGYNEAVPRSLEWAEGTFPTPYGPVYVRHEKDGAGKVISEIKAPKGVKVIK